MTTQMMNADRVTSKMGLSMLSSYILAWKYTPMMIPVINQNMTLIHHWIFCLFMFIYLSKSMKD